MNGEALGFFIAFPLIWVTVVIGIGWLSGWTALARAYPSRSQMGGRRFRFQSARVRFGGGYGSCLTFGADPAGLHLSILFLFRPGHPPLFVPWSDVSFHEGSRRGVALRFARAPGVPFIVSKQLAAELAAASSGAFAYPAGP